MMDKKTKEFGPKIYSVVLESPRKHFYVWTGVAYCLDEALIASRGEANKSVGANEYWRLFIFNALSFEEINSRLEMLSKMTSSEKEQKECSETAEKTKESWKLTKKMQVSSEKNALMKQIVKEKDEFLYKKHVKKFNVNERRMLREKIKSKGKTK